MQSSATERLQNTELNNFTYLCECVPLFPKPSVRRGGVGVSGNRAITVVPDQAYKAANHLVNGTVVCNMKVETLVTNNGGGHSKFRGVKESTVKYKDNTQADRHMKDDGEGVCYNCLHGGVLLRCRGKRCGRRYHPTCVDPPLKYTPPGLWYCIWCVKKMIEIGVHSVSEGVESILDFREVFSKDKVMQREYFVKYQGLAHAHNRWIPETQMLLEAPKLLGKFKRKFQVIKWKREWSIPHRLLRKREIKFLKLNNEHLDGDDDIDSVCRYQWLVKWTGLGYDHVTWELYNASFMTSSEGMKLIEDYKSRRKSANKLSDSFEANKGRKASFTELSVLPYGDSPGLYNQYLSYVNKLRMCWHKGQSALIVDDQIDQDRVMKVILFILSLHCNVKRPFLIISTSTALSVWETELLHTAPSANLVVYKGNKDTRSSIRELEFYDDDGGILFQILLASSDIIIEDLHALSCIQWEAIIIDECQRPSIIKYLDNMTALAAEMRLVLVSGQMKEDRADYIKLLSLLKSGHHGLNIAPVENYSSASISDLKSQLEKYVAFKSTRFVEYWVPAALSNLQLEQYCSMLLSNSALLCSGQNSGKVDALRDLIISTRKCCDHPFLLDHSLHNFVTRGLPVEEHLNIGIKASGKLQLLEKILSEVRIRGLKVILLFQSTSGGSASIGDILDDVLCQRFGKDCYVRYDRLYTPPKKQAALDTFNSGESGKFVFLIENKACQSSVKLSSVDTVILYDSDWDPQNDLRALHRMSISSQFKQLNVFKLYSSFTVEERILMLAKEGIAPDSDMQYINRRTCHTLLKWGASHLFNKLDELHGSGTSVSAADISSNESLLNDVMCELSSQLVCRGDDTDCHGWSFISRTQLNGWEYARNILLLGERVMKKLDNTLHVFYWSDLLRGRHPQWKFLSVSSQRIRKTVKYFDQSQKESEDENDPIIRERRNVSKYNINPKDNVDATRRKVSKDSVDPKKRKVSTKDSVDPKRRKVPKDIADSKSRKASKDFDNSKYLKTRLKKKKIGSSVKKASIKNGNMDGLSKVLDSTVHRLISDISRPAAMNEQYSKQKLHDMPKGTEFLPNPDVSGLCDVLHLPKKVKAIAKRILEHILKHYNINCEDVSTMQAFKISVCWLSASLLKHKIDKKDSLALAKLYLNFNCTEMEANEVYSEMRKFEKDFSSCLQNERYVEKCNINGASDSEIPQLKDLAEEDKQKCFLGKSPRTVLSSQDMNYVEKFHSSSSMARETCLSQNTTGSLPVEGDVVSMELESDEDDRMDATNSVAAEVSFLEDQNKVPNSSDNPHNVNPVTSSLERHSPIRSTGIAESDGEVSEVSHIFVNEVVAVDTAMNMSTHPAQLDSAETDAVNCDGTIVPEVSQSDNVSGPACGESTTLEVAQTTLPSMQLSHANSLPLPQGNSASTAMPLDETFCNSGRDHSNLDEADVLLQAPNDTVEPVNSSFISPVTQQLPTTAPMNGYTAHVPHRNTNPRFMNNYRFQAQYATSETPPTTYPDPLAIEMEKIEKVKEEVLKIQEKKTLQLQSDLYEEMEKLREKYIMLQQDVDTEAALKLEELETQSKIALMNKVLAEAWIDAEYIEQVPIPSSSSSHVPRHHASHMPAQELAQFSSGPSIIHPSFPTPMMGIHSPRTIPQIRPVSACINPMTQSFRNLHDGHDLLAPAPPLGAYAATSPYSVPLMPNGFHGISDHLQHQT
ncbi:hypothetical protein RIF29_39952 [Crotalaria pallida]|uniref:Uncharacterized protein n=1 Tax=Crotalaria pallida TaxID=3830 RepID=A0AAN9HTU6_CROPI